MTTRVCVQCGRRIREGNEKAEMIFLRPSGAEVWLCGPKCETKYNETDTPDE